MNAAIAKEGAKGVNPALSSAGFRPAKRAPKEPAARRRSAGLCKRMLAPCMHALVESRTFLRMFGSSMKKSALFALAAVVCFPAWGQAPQHIDINGITGQNKGTEMIENVVVPVPSEIFTILDKLGAPPWTEVLRPMKEAVQPRGTPEQISLLLGTVIAEGFVAVEAQNSEAVKNIGSSVLNLATAIGVKQAVESRANAIIQNANKKDWPAVRTELDRAQRNVKAGMVAIHSEDLSQLVSLGGWLRGTEALTQVVLKNYTPAGAELLHQPVLLKYFKHRIEGIKNKTPLVLKIQKGLDEVEPLMNGDPDNGEISEKAVKDIQTIASDLIKAINQKP
jgi:hypothetical protein